MAVRSTLRIEGIREARERIDEVGDRARRPEPALRAPATRRDLQESERRRFTTYRWKADTDEWRRRKAREGLDPRTMVATGRLRAALENAEGGSVRFNVFNGTLTWGLRAGRSDLYYAQVQAGRGRRAVVIDRVARASIAQRVESFLAHGFVR
jgi:hypothetical protein